MVVEWDDIERTVSPHLDMEWAERVWSRGGVVHIAARARELTVACPDCGRGSTRVHSRYCRTLAGAAVGGRPVLIRLSVRRLFCDAPACARRTFAEQVERLSVRYQRRSALLQHLLKMAGVLLADRGGTRLLQILKAPLSRTSVLFQLMRMLLPLVATPQVLGVDDFALYADTYGTLLMDAESRLPIELRSGRDAEQLASWLRAHPGVRVVCRGDGAIVSTCGSGRRSCRCGLAGEGLDPRRPVPVHGGHCDGPGVGGLEPGEQGGEPLAGAVAADCTVAGFEHAVAAEVISMAAVTAAVAFVVLQQKIADVEDPAGLQDAVQLGDQPVLGFIAGNAGQHGEE